MIWDCQKLKDARRDAGFKQNEAASRLGIAAEYLSPVEAGKQNPSNDLVCQMAELYHVTIWDLVQEKYQVTTRRKK